MVIFHDMIYPADGADVGSHVAFLWWYKGKWLDFFRIKKMRRPEFPNILYSPNEFIFEAKCSDE